MNSQKYTPKHTLYCEKHCIPYLSKFCLSVFEELSTLALKALLDENITYQFVDDSNVLHSYY